MRHEDGKTALGYGYLVPGEFLAPRDPDCELFESIRAALPLELRAYVPGWEIGERIDWEMTCLVLVRPLALATIDEAPVRVDEEALRSAHDTFAPEQMRQLEALCDGIRRYLTDPKHLVCMTHSDGSGGNRGAMVYGQEIDAADAERWSVYEPTLSVMSFGNIYDDELPSRQLCAIELNNDSDDTSYFESSSVSLIEYQSVYFVDIEAMERARQMFHETAPRAVDPGFYLFCEYG